jgi:hypothetical protein
MWTERNGNKRVMKNKRGKLKDKKNRRKENERKE